MIRHIKNWFSVVIVVILSVSVFGACTALTFNHGGHSWADGAIIGGALGLFIVHRFVYDRWCELRGE